MEHACLAYIDVKKTHYITLGSFILKLVTNQPDQYFGKYFSEHQYLQPSEFINEDFTIYVNETASIPNELFDRVEEDWRAGVMRKGYYTAQYFGPPVIMIRQYRTIYLFGKNLDKIVWRYCIKMLLTTLSYEKNMLHLKASAFQCGNSGYLLVSPGSQGKTTLLHQMMEHGAKFLTNTHVLIDKNLVAEGIHSNLRFRNIPADTRFEFKNANVGQISKGEFNIDPFRLYLSDNIAASMKINAIIITQKNTDGKLECVKCEPETAFDVIQFFGAPIQTYNLKQDIFEYCDRNYMLFSAMVKQIEENIKDLLKSVPCYLLSVDVFEEKNSRKLYELLYNNLNEN
ncbi:hypothetical protein [Paenibacillus wynnii]|uniref:hypothetical protein n=1 Tax=Paenibacillus wynnii TaxID=268407 RepID=UPI00068E0EFE|nr:hypothetical protein [Paenibacillus wynnii]